MGKELEFFRKDLLAFQQVRWHEQWKKLVLPIFQIIGGVDSPSYTFPGLAKHSDWKGWGDAGSDSEQQGRETATGSKSDGGNEETEAEAKKDK